MKILNIKKYILASAMAFVAAFAAPAMAEEKDVSVVLVHGALADGSSWRKVIPLLQEKGIKVTAVQLGLSSLADDAATVSRLIDVQTGPHILVGHSYGGIVISEAGMHQDVDALVYVASYMLEPGQTFMDLQGDNPPAEWQKQLIPDAAGFMRLPASAVSTYLAQDLPQSETTVLAATQGSFNIGLTKQILTNAAWQSKPSHYVITAQDRVISPKAQSYFADKISAKVTEIDAGHLPMLSQPQAVADVILRAVTDVSTN